MIIKLQSLLTKKRQVMPTTTCQHDNRTTQHYVIFKIVFVLFFFLNFFSRPFSHACDRYVVGEELAMSDGSADLARSRRDGTFHRKRTRPISQSVYEAEPVVIRRDKKTAIPSVTSLLVVTTWRWDSQPGASERARPVVHRRNTTTDVRLFRKSWHIYRTYHTRLQ